MLPRLSGATIAETFIMQYTSICVFPLLKMGDGSDSELTLFPHEILNQYIFLFVMIIGFFIPLLKIVYLTYKTRDRWEMRPQRMPANLDGREYDPYPLGVKAEESEIPETEDEEQKHKEK